MGFEDFRQPENLTAELDRIQALEDAGEKDIELEQLFKNRSDTIEAIDLQTRMSGGTPGNWDERKIKLFPDGRAILYEIWATDDGWPKCELLSQKESRGMLESELLASQEIINLTKKRIEVISGILSK